MHSFRLLLLVLSMGAMLSSCGQTTASPTATATPILASQAKAYLTAVLDIMQQHSVNRKNINWTALRQEAFVDANGAQTPAETYVAIKLVVRKLGDHHSFFLDPQQAQQLETGQLTPNQGPMGSVWLMELAIWNCRALRGRTRQHNAT